MMDCSYKEIHAAFTINNDVPTIPKIGFVGMNCFQTNVTHLQL